MARRVAIVGVGQARAAWEREDASLPAMIHEAVRSALEMAGLAPRDIDAVVFGSGPGYFEGVNHPEKWAAGASGAFMKPQMCIHSGESGGATAGVAGFYHVASGMFDVVLAVSGNKPSEGNVAPVPAACRGSFFSGEIPCGTVAVVGLQSAWYMSKYGYTEEQAAKVAVKNRRNALKNPYARSRMEMTVEDVLGSPMISSPLKLLDCSPPSDGAAALVFATEEKARRICRRPAWIKGVSAMREGLEYPDRNWANPVACKKAATLAYRQAGIDDPPNQIDVAEVYDLSSFNELMWYEGLFLCDEGQGGRMIDEGITEMTGRLPVNPSGGVLGYNATGAAGILRQGEAALQVMGAAGEHQVEGVETAVAHGLGGAMQFHAVMVLSSGP